MIFGMYTKSELDLEFNKRHFYVCVSPAPVRLLVTKNLCPLS